MNTVQGVGWRGQAWISPGLGVFLGQAGGQDWHCHMAHQITIGLATELTVHTPGSEVRARAVCIRAGVMHRIEAIEILSIYLDALSEEAFALHAGADAITVDIDMEAIFALQSLLAEPNVSAQQMRDRVRQALSLANASVIDPRLQTVLAAVRESIHGRQYLARLVHLSPTRFSHWFVEQTGLPLRSYRKWSRLVAALQNIAAGRSLTEAAHAAGFADAAHFSRTFRNLFGLDPTSALGHVHLIG
ncbi:helix-turn-helix domain-containing protein [Pseudomonas aeruginosa]|nr:helix-turn-helix domain-containing protein [Pseudomonas aeruginosa]RUJ43141.1 helix-turn-helix domain-containing protein [Pseudomonas aeruginosa]